MIGEVLSGRYELVEEIGSGGMAIVYRAKDLLLARMVAIKVLRPEMAADHELWERFLREAQSAAMLSHPNVVNIYDVNVIDRPNHNAFGAGSRLHYLVMEYVEGKNLKDVIRELGPLPIHEAISIAEQTLRALRAAHRRGIVHRDVKPHNILLMPDGRVKVTDFGIARAVSAATITETGMVLGSVHYIAPEQARGLAGDARSDLYALGCVLYEMVTGELPFTADTAVAVALKHVQEAPLSPRHWRAEVPPALSAAILRSLAKSADDRYQSADEMLYALQRIRSGLALEDTRETVAPESELETTRIRGRAFRDALVEQGAPIAPNGNGEGQGSGTSSGSPQGGGRRPMRWRQWLIGVVLVLAGAGWAAARLPKVLFPPEVVVPAVEGLTFIQAQRRLEDAGLVPHLEKEVFHSSVPARHVVSQEPAAGRRVRKGRTVNLSVSKGEQQVQVPGVVGLSLQEAKIRLTQTGLTMGEVTQEFEPTLPVGSVLRQDPPSGARTDRGTPVQLVVNIDAARSALINVPDLTGVEIEAARTRIEALGLTIGKVLPEDSDQPEGTILAQNPPPGTQVTEKTAVDFVYAIGKREEATPQRPPTQSAVQWHQAALQIEVPPGPPQEVVVIIRDDLGTREALRRMLNGGVKLVHNVRGRGPTAQVSLYIGGVLKHELVACPVPQAVPDGSPGADESGGTLSATGVARETAGDSGAPTESRAESQAPPPDMCW